MKNVKKLPHGPQTSSILQAMQWLSSPYDILAKNHQKYGHSYTMNIFGLGKLAVFCEPQAVKELLVDHHSSLSIGKAHRFLSPIVGNNSLVLIDGEKHQQHRRMISPILSKERMMLYGELMRKVTADTMSKVPLGQEFSMLSYSKKITLEVMLRLMFGDIEKKQLEKMTHLFLQLFSFFYGRNVLLLYYPILQRNLGPFSPWAKFIQIRGQIDSFIYSEIKKRQDTPGKDMVSALLLVENSQGQKMSPKELRDEIVTLIRGGYETSASSLAWAFYWIHHTSEVLPKLTKEINNTTDEANCPYLEAICKETLRIRPLDSILVRSITEPIHVLNYEIPPGVYGAAGVYLIHHREDIYKKPGQFLPERFLEQEYSPYEFLPFGVGARRCIGVSFGLYAMKIVLATTLRQCKLQLLQKTVKPVLKGITVFPDKGIRMMLTTKTNGTGTLAKQE